jgi:hypothetical protein
MLGGRLLEQGWAVRGTSRSEEGLAAIEEAGIEPAIADPLWPGTILELVGDVAVVIWLLGSARGEEESLAAIHGERLGALLERLVDTPVRGFVYEGAGSVDAALLGRGTSLVRDAAGTWHIPCEVLAEPDSPRFATEAADAASRCLAGIAK